MGSSKLAAVEAYLIALDAAKGKTLGAVIDVILQHFPELEVRIAWNVPQVCRGSDYVFGVSAATHHLALAPWSATVIATFRARLEADGYAVKKNLFQVPVDWQVDQSLLRDLVAARLAELD